MPPAVVGTVRLVRVPEQLSVVSFDDTMIAQWTPGWLSVNRSATSGHPPSNVPRSASLSPILANRSV